MTLSDKIRTMIRNSGVSQNRIAIEAGLPSSAMARFLSGKSMTSKGLDCLAPVLGLKVTADPKAIRKLKAAAKATRRRTRAAKKGG